MAQNHPFSQQNNITIQFPGAEFYEYLYKVASNVQKTEIVNRSLESRVL